MSKVRGYDYVCSRWSAKKKNMQMPVKKQQHTSNTLFKSLVITTVVRLFVNLLTLIHLSFSSLLVDPWDTPGELFFVTKNQKNHSEPLSKGRKINDKI